MSNRKDKKSTVVKSLFENYLQRYVGIITPDPKDDDKFICLPCSKHGLESHFLWVSLNGHMKTKNHKTAVEDGQKITINLPEEQQQKDEPLLSNQQTRLSNKTPPIKSEEIFP